MPRSKVRDAWSSLPPKEVLKAELIARLHAQLESAERAHQAAVEGATHEQAKAESDKDTRGLEQSYIARGQAKRVEELRLGLAAVEAMPLRVFTAKDPVGLGALVDVDEDEQSRTVLLAPHGGGVQLADGAVHVITPHSPMGAALVGRSVGDAWEAELAGRTRTLEVVRLG